MTKAELRQHLLSAPPGTSPEGIIRALRDQGVQMEGDPTPPPKGLLQSAVEGAQQFASNVGQDINNRASQLNEAAADYQSGRQGFLSSALQATGALAGGVNDVISEGVSAITPDFIEDGVSAAVGAVAGTSPVQGAMQSFQDWATMHPEAAKNLSAVVDIASLIPSVKGAEVAGNALVKGAKALPGIAKKGVGEVKDSLAAASDDIATAKEAKLTAKAEKLVQPEATTKLIKDVGAKNPELVDEGLFSTSLKTSPAEKNLAQTALKNVKGFTDSKNPVKTAKKVKETITSKSEALRSTFKANDATLSQQEIGAAVKTKVAEAAKDFGDQPGIFESTRNVWDKISAKHPGTLSGQWQARIEFYQEVQKRYGGSIFDKGTARAEAVRSIGQAANEAIEQAAKKAGMSFQKEIDEIADLFSIQENLSTKFSSAGPVKKALRTPAGRIGVSAAAGAAGLGAYQSIAN